MTGLDALAVGGLGPDGKGVTDPRDARHAVGGLLAVQGPTALDIRTGVLAGPGSTALVVGTSDTGQMTYAINPFVGVGSRGTANGPYLGPTLDAQTKVNADPAPGTGSRIDVIYFKQQDGQSGIPSPDATTGPLYGVLKGDSSTGTPVKPDLSTIAGATELATAQVSAGAVSTNDSHVIITNTARQTVARGGAIPVHNQAERDALTKFDGLEVFRLDTGKTELCFGNQWYVQAREEILSRYRTFQRATGTGSDSYTSASGFVALVGGTWSNAPAGDYMIHTTLLISGSANLGGNIQVTANGGTISQPNTHADVGTFATTLTHAHPYTHAGGDLAIGASHLVSSGTATVFNASCKQVLVYLGRSS